MSTKTRYQFLEKAPGKNTIERSISGTGIRVSTIWHDRYISRLSPKQIADDREIPVEAVYEALSFCQEHWEKICSEKDLQRSELEQRGFFRPNSQ